MYKLKNNKIFDITALLKWYFGAQKFNNCPKNA